MNPNKYLLFFLLFLTFRVFANEATTQQVKALTSKEILQSMAHAMQVLNYQGTVVFFKNNRLEPMKYFHAAHENQEQERLLSLNSPLREIIRDNGIIRCLYKETQHHIEDNRPFERSFLVDLPKNIDTLDNSYTLTLLNDESIAMLPAYVLSIVPKDNLRYARKLWIEKQHFLPLKTVVYDLDNNMVEQVVFTDMETKQNLPFVDKFLFDEKLNKTPEIYPLTDARFDITQLPSGFTALFFTRHSLHNNDQPVDHLLLSDGLAWISIYMEQKNSALQSKFDANKTVQAIGSINFYSRIVDNYEFTVLGDVPAETIKLIAENVKLRNN